MTYDVRDNLRRTLERHFMLFLLVVVRLSCILFLSGGFAAFTILFEIPELFFLNFVTYANVQLYM